MIAKTPGYMTMHKNMVKAVVLSSQVLLSLDAKDLTEGQEYQHAKALLNTLVTMQNDFRLGHFENHNEIMDSFK